MGTWGSGIFEDDLALDVKGDFEGYLKEGLNIKDATKQILQDYTEVLADEDEGPVVYLALAALQQEHGNVQPELKERALRIIDTGQGLERWEEAGPESLAERQEVLQELQRKLQTDVPEQNKKRDSSKLAGGPNRTKQLQIGDVFEIETPKGKAYFQYVYHKEKDADLIRILPGLYEVQPQDMMAIVAAKEVFFTQFVVKVACKHGGIKLIGNFAIPESVELPTKMREGYKGINGRMIWSIVDRFTLKRENFRELTEEQKKLSPHEIWDDTLLIKRLAEGWTLDKWG